MKTIIDSTTIAGKEYIGTMLYDKNGNVIYCKDDDLEIFNEYDENNNLIKTKRSDGYWAKFEYDNNGYLSHYQNQKGYNEIYENGKLIKSYSR